MCGIAGILGRSHEYERSKKLTRALDAMVHRGPDGLGIEACEAGKYGLSLGHRRLAIIDLSDAGLQPRRSLDGRFVVTFNGEIYNFIELRRELQQLGHVFHSSTDTEVLVAAWAEWGKECLDRLDGMFAFAIFDRVAQTLTCVRDPFGIKPFFYSVVPDGFAFASEIQAMVELVDHPPQINLARAHQFLCWGDYDDRGDSFFANFLQLCPGFMLELDLSRDGPLNAVLSRWWWPDIAEASGVRFEDAADELRHLFLQSVRRQLRSDVALGTTLSGGVDSSALACAMRHVEPGLPIKSFSYSAGDPRLNESRWAKLVIDAIDAKDHWVDDSSSNLSAELDEIIAAQGEPFGSTSILASYRVMRLAREHGITVTLDGQGADELLAGYQGYPAAAFSSMGERGAILELAKFVRKWKNQPGRSWRLAALHLGDAFVPAGLRREVLSLAGYDTVPDWLDKSAFESANILMEAPYAPPTNPDGKGRRLAERLRNALSSNRLPALLRHGDRNSMRWSIESRVPFLSPALAKFVLRLPERFLLSSEAETKHIFRHAMRGIVPDPILDRKDKIGFETPELQFLRQERKWVDQCLEAAREVSFIKFEPFLNSVNGILDGKERFSFRAWRMINFSRWSALYSLR